MPGTPEALTAEGVVMMMLLQPGLCQAGGWPHATPILRMSPQRSYSLDGSICPGIEIHKSRHQPSLTPGSEGVIIQLGTWPHPSCSGSL